MRSFFVEESIELNSIYCLCILKVFSKIDVNKLSLCHFLLRYPKNFSKFSFSSENILEDTIFLKDGVGFSLGWSKNINEILMLLYAKDLVRFNDNQEVIYAEKTHLVIREISKYKEFEEIILRLESIKKEVEKKDIDYLRSVING